MIQDHLFPVAQRFSAAKIGLAGLKPCATLVLIQRGRHELFSIYPAHAAEEILIERVTCLR